MNVKFLLMCLLILGADDRRLPQLPLVTNDPNDPENTRSVVYREEREKLGLTPNTWTGIVHPDVYPRFDQLEKTIANLKERVKTKDEQAFRALSGIKFPGMVYVQVQLEPDPNGVPIKGVQRRVLASLKASEFHPQYLFEKVQGFVGYTNKEALDKLAKNPDVTGVCLDEKVLPEGPAKIILRDDLPPPKLGDTSSDQPGVKEGKVEADVYRALDLSERVEVEVHLRTEGLPKLSDRGPEIQTRWELRKQAEKQLHDSVLSALSADDFMVVSKFGPGMLGFVTREGLQKLWKHNDVLRIRLQRLARPPEILK